MEELLSFDGQGLLQVTELLLAFVLSAAVGLERQVHGKSAGLRTQAIVGTSSALFVLVSKYGFMDVLADDVVLDPSRVAAQVVSGIGFLGAGLILTRRGTVRGLTTAASVWETAAIGMAAGAGLWVLALVVTVLHFAIAYGLTGLAKRLPGSRIAQLRVEVVYADGRGLLRLVLDAVTSAGWTVTRAIPRDSTRGRVVLELELAGPADVGRLISVIADIDGVRDVHLSSEDEFD